MKGVLKFIGALCAAPVLAASLLSARDDELTTISPSEIKRILQHELPAVPPDSTNRFADDPAAAHFGQFLFFDKRFSANGAVSCATCHDPARDFADSATLGRGLNELSRHTPALWNVAYNRWFFWDGRADTLWAQALDPLENDSEFGGNRLRIVHALADDQTLHTAYETVFGKMPAFDDRARFPRDAKPMPHAPDNALALAWRAMRIEDQHLVNEVFANFGKAIAAYERNLISRNAPFDRFVEALKRGEVDKRILSPAALRGLRLFIGEANCRLCHTGPNFSDGEFHNNGLPFDQRLQADPGRFEGAARLLASPFNAAGEFSDDRGGEGARKSASLVKSAETWGQFKTPGLRNVAKTAPYMHQGQFTSLREVLQFYSTLQGQVLVGHHQETLLKPAGLTDHQVADLQAFLESLTGSPIDESLLVQPASPIPQAGAGKAGPERSGS